MTDAPPILPPVPHHRPPYPYSHPRHPWCQPGDEPHRAFILRFSDPDMREQVFLGEGAEADAWAAWDRFGPAWNVYLFGIMPQAQRPASQDLEDIIADALQDSLDVDWTCRTGAKHIIEALRKAGAL